MRTVVSVAFRPPTILLVLLTGCARPPTPVSAPPRPTLPAAEPFSYRFAYDSHDRLSAWSDGEGRVVQLSWDSAGRLTSVKAPEGTTKLGYDADGRLVAAAGPGAVVSYDYDVLGRLTQLGRVCKS